MSYNKISYPNKNLLLTLLYVVIIYLVTSFLFFIFFREPYPSINMPGFSSADAVGELIPFRTYEAIIFLQQDTVAQIDLREIYGEVPEGMYPRSMNYLFFGPSSYRGAEGRGLREKFFTLFTGNVNSFKNINQWANPPGPENAESLVPLNLCQRLYSHGYEFDRVEIVQFVNWSELHTGIPVNREIGKIMSFLVQPPCEK